MRLKPLSVLVAVCVVLMATESFAIGRDSCYAATDTCYVCKTPRGSITELDLGVCDTVRIGCPFIIPTIVPGDSIMVPIYVWNDELLGGFTLGFKFNSTELEVVKNRYDLTGSVIPADGIENGWIGEAIYDTIPGQYLFGWVEMTGEEANRIPVNTTNKAKLLVTLNFKVKSTATPMTIVIDSSYMPPAGPFVLSMQNSNDDAFSVHPQYVHCPEGDIILGGIPCGDVDGSHHIDIADAIYLIYYIFGYGAPPQDASGGDVDCDLSVTIADVVYFINYIFSGGPQPCEGCK